MRQRAEKDGLSVHAIAGNHSVLLGFDAAEEARRGLLGFAIQRTDQKNGESRWLQGCRHFERDAAEHPLGTSASTWISPIQGFLWGDWAAKPDRSYTYSVLPVYGKPGDLKHGPAVDVTVSTELEAQDVHAVYFNRGVAGSQAYAEKFHNRPPDEVGAPAFQWLSRGLVEALTAFLKQAEGPGWGLYAAVYEFSYPPVLTEFRAALDRGAEVHIVFDDKAVAGGPGAANRQALDNAGLTAVAVPRRANPSYISHNKFVVLTRNGVARQVWTGSTNITEGGIFGHSNVGHAVRDPEVAAAYLDYWRQLAADPSAEDLRAWNEAHSPLPRDRSQKVYIEEVFSPRSSLAALQWYSEAMDEAKNSVFLTAAFGVNDLFQKVLQEDKPYLRYVLLDKPGKGLDLMERDRDNLFSIGSLLDASELDRWGREKWREEKLTGLNQHVQYIHTKYMLIDPLTDPLVIAGSANFSDNSTRNNDENMLIIRGDERVADLYLTEFMRLFQHFRVRGTPLGLKAERSGGKPVSLYLAPDDSWTRPYYQAGHPKRMERLLFAGAGEAATAGAELATLAAGR
ncbi:MAG TPA: phospholipase D-like domain-containing protein [Thermoanaerobaculia bacterium]